MLDQHGQVFQALAQRRHLQRKYIQPVEEVLAKTPAEYGRLQIAMGRGNDAHVTADGAVAADALEAPFLQHTQQFHLHLQAHVADLVEKQGAALRELEAADPRRQRAGEGTLFMAEQLALQQVGGNRAAIHGNERMPGPIRQFMDVPGRHFLAGARLAENEDVGVERRHLLDQAVHRAHGARFAARAKFMAAGLGGMAAAHALRLGENRR